jgi:hypothetical protein
LDIEVLDIFVEHGSGDSLCLLFILLINPSDPS